MAGRPPRPMSPPTASPASQDRSRQDVGACTGQFSDLASGHYLEGTYYLLPIPYYPQPGTQGLETYSPPTSPHPCGLLRLPFACLLSSLNTPHLMEFLSESLHLLLQTTVLVGGHALPSSISAQSMLSEGRRLVMGLELMVVLRLLGVRLRPRKAPCSLPGIFDSNFLLKSFLYYNRFEDVFINTWHVADQQLLQGEIIL